MLNIIVNVGKRDIKSFVIEKLKDKD